MGAIADAIELVEHPAIALCANRSLPTLVALEPPLLLARCSAGGTSQRGEVLRREHGAQLL